MAFHAFHTLSFPWPALEVRIRFRNCRNYRITKTSSMTSSSENLTPTHTPSTYRTLTLLGDRPVAAAVYLERAFDAHAEGVKSTRDTGPAERTARPWAATHFPDPPSWA